MALGVGTELRWEICPAPGCAGAVIAGGRCLAHLDDGAMKTVLARVARAGPLDARGVLVDDVLLRRVLDAAPTDERNRRRLRRAKFDGASFAAGIAFDDVVFENGVSFDGAIFAGAASFARTEFGGHARFGRVSFIGPVQFDAAIFTGQCWFASATFAGPSSFQETVFRGPAWFGRAVFDTDVRFDRAILTGDVTFVSAEFRCHTVFAGVAFEAEARFDDASFAHEAGFSGAAFKGKGGAPAAAVRQAIWSGAALAPWTSRVAAAAIDQGTVVALFVGAWGLALVLGLLHYDHVLGFLLVAAAVAGITFTVHNLVAQGRTGQTAGKRRMGLCLVRQRDGLPVGAAPSLSRHALHLVDVASCGFGFVRPLWDKKRQTLADKLAGTVVILRRRGWGISSDLPREEAPAPGGG